MNLERGPADLERGPADLERVAAEARAAFEAGTIPTELLGEVYLAYNPNVRIKSFLREAAKYFPALNCGLASAYLRHVIGAGELVRGRYGPHAHTFLLVADEIVDITADQYGGPPVHVGPLHRPWSR